MVFYKTPLHSGFFSASPFTISFPSSLERKMDQNSNTVSDARTPPPEVVKLNERIVALEESEYALMMENYRLKTKRRRLKKSFNRLAGRFLLMKEKYTAMKDERDRLAQDEY